MGKTETDSALNAPPLVDDVVVAVDQPAAVEVALKTIVAQLLPQAEGHVHVTGIVVHIQQMGAHEMPAERGTQPVTRLGLHGNVAPLLVVAEGKGVVTEGKVERPFAGDPVFKSDIGRDGGPPHRIGLHGHILRRSPDGQKQKQSHAGCYRPTALSAQKRRNV